MFYSATTCGFYDHYSNNAIPADAGEITSEQHAALLAGQSDGRIITADEQGYPVLTDPPPATLDTLRDCALLMLPAWEKAERTSGIEHAGQRWLTTSAALQDIRDVLLAGAVLGEQWGTADRAGLLYLVTEKFANIDLHPASVDNASMGLVFEELIRKFAEISNETAGEHFTPREVIRLMVNLLFIEDDDVLTAGNAVVRTLYDPTAGTGGMLSVAGEFLAEHNPQARLTLFGQELNDESYAICKADMLIKGQDVGNIVAGNTLSDDGHGARKFDYMLCSAPWR
ncbi:N-6 DNA methylase [Laribacter hongkongensis]|uniref:N-6 DNA methylase n=1 Tax=Laribacter hongkongensis TaxID=168471 RepID=UPI00040276E5|nr:N-6 DNA methylase [Laribacter hongkongensis]